MATERRWYKWFYDNIHSREYDLLMRWLLLPFGGERRFREEMLSDVTFSPAERILDLCCGTGGCTFALREKAGAKAEIIGVDLSSGQVRIARKKNKFGNVRFIEADATDTGLEDEYFDKVLITHALHEMPRETRLRVLAEARRVMNGVGKLIVLELDNPGGLGRRLLLSLWFFYWIPWPLNFENRTRRDMLRRGLANEVREAKFRNVQKVSKFHGTMQVVIGER